MVTIVFLFQNCLTFIRGTSQEIPVTSNPSGAKIIVNGKEMGYAPLLLKLKRKKKSYVIRIEKQDYNLLEIKIIRKRSALLSELGNVPWGIIGGYVGYRKAHVLSEDAVNLGDYLMTYFGLVAAGVILGGAGAAAVDGISGASYKLSPKELNVTLKKIEGNPQPNFILIDAEQFQNIKWIRIKCADSDGEEIVNLD
jgi:hypothetical protein